MTATHLPPLHHYRLFATVMLAAAIAAMAMSLVASAWPQHLRPAPVADEAAVTTYFTVLPPPPMYTVLPPPEMYTLLP